MINDIEKIIKIFESAKISKLDLEFDNVKIKLEKNDENIIYNSQANTITEANNINTTHEVNGLEIKSPVVGTYYAQKQAGEEPFIKVGSKVKKGDTLCIIEAMKVMNEIKSPCDGTILEIRANNDELVEYDKTIIVIGE